MFTEDFQKDFKEDIGKTEGIGREFTEIILKEFTEGNLIEFRMYSKVFPQGY